MPEKDLIHEDELPPDISQEDYDRWYAQSFVPDGVGCRVGPRLNTPTTAAVEAREIVGTVFQNAAASHETLEATMIERITDYLSRYLPAPQPEVGTRTFATAEQFLDWYNDEAVKFMESEIERLKGEVGRLQARVMELETDIDTKSGYL